MIKISTGLANYVAETGSLRSVLTGGKLHLFSTQQPANADLGHAGLLATISGTAGAGLTFSTPAANGQFEMSGVWEGVGLLAGKALSFRYCCDPLDDGLGASSAYERIDGTIGITGSSSDATVDNTSIAVGQKVTATSFSFGISRG